MSRKSPCQLLKEWILNKHPYGFDFSGTAMRLCPVANATKVVETVKGDMFQNNEKVWLFPEQVAKRAVVEHIRGHAAAWATSHQFFSVRALYHVFLSDLSNLSSDDDFIAFFQFIAPEFPLQNGFWTPQPEQLVPTLERLAKKIESEVACHGEITQDRISSLFSYLAPCDIEKIIENYSECLYWTEIDEVACWKHRNALHLPDDFPARLKKIIDQIREFGFELTKDQIMLALCLSYGYDVRAETDLGQPWVFHWIVLEYTQGTWLYNNRRLKIANAASGKPKDRTERGNVVAHSTVAEPDFARTPDMDGPISFTLANIPELTFTDPESLTIGNVTLHASKWIKLIGLGLKEFYHLKPDAMRALLGHYSWFNATGVTRNGDPFIKKVTVAPGIYFSGHHDTKRLVDHLMRVANGMGFDLAAIQITARRDSSPEDE